MRDSATPSWKQGFAHNAAESEYPNLWKGLVGLWAPSLGPTGLTLFDQSGYGNHGTLTNMSPADDWIPGDPRSGGYALSFNADTKYVAIPNMGITTSALSIVALVRWTANVGLSWGRIIHRANGATSDDWALSVRLLPPKELAFRIRTAGGVVTISDGPSVPSNTWAVLAGIYDGTRMSVYVNAVQGGAMPAQSGAISDSGESGAIGRHKDSDVRDFHGHIASVSVHDRALTLSEIQLLYERPNAMLELRRRVFPAAVGAPPSFQAAWTDRINQHIGLGI